MEINEIVLSVTGLIILFSLYKIYFLKVKCEEKNGTIVDFKEKVSSRYMYYSPILQIENENFLFIWDNNPKLDKKMLNQNLTILKDDKNKLYEKKQINIHYIVISIATLLFLFAMKNLNLF